MTYMSVTYKSRALMSIAWAALFFFYAQTVSAARLAEISDTLAQTEADKGNFRYPLDVTMNLSGNYGELRSNHFHSGIDFRVGGVVGAPIFAAADGYVSRISVSPTGYGNALYITHPDGHTTVYGHMLRFADRIRKYVRDRQYENEAFALDEELGPEVFPVKKGEQIGNAGNTGSSGGPHLHFEVRETESGLPLNVFGRKFLTIPDKTSPVFNKVAFYGFEEKWGVPFTYLIGEQSGTAAYRPMGFSSKTDVVELPACSYVAVDAVDKQEETYAKLAVNEYKVYLDTSLVFALEIGEVPFDKGRYINSLIEYSQKVKSGKSLIKSYVEPGNDLSDHIFSRNDGLIVLHDTLPHRVKIEVLDIGKNKSVRSFTVRRTDSLFAAAVPDSLPAGPYMDWHLVNIYSAGGLDIVIPPLSLYSPIYFYADTLPERITPYAPVWRIHSEKVPLHKPAALSLKASVPDSLASKALLAKVGWRGRLSSVGGKYENGAVSGSIGSFGDYTVTVDTEPPTIVSGIRNNETVKKNGITFIIRDRLSGLGNYRVEMDGHWVLAEFDAKSSRLSVPLEEARIKKGIRHQLKVTVRDNKDNVSVLKRTFIW